jgi:hypothetical protein
MTRSKSSKRFVAGSAVALVAALAAIPAALAGGEPKNEAPFTRIVAPRVLTKQLAPSHAAATLSVMGEAKNQAPFSRLQQARSLVVKGEAKNQSPFTRR